MKLYEDTKYLTSEDEIIGFFEDVAYDELDCGQGYYMVQGEAFAKIGDDYYLVEFKGDIESAKQDRGDRLYWVESVTNITYEAVESKIVFDTMNRVVSLQIAEHQKSIDELRKKLFS